MAMLVGQGTQPVACKGASRHILAAQPFSSIRQRIRVNQKQSRGAFRVLASNVSTEPAGPVNDETFKQLVLESDVPVLVDFWAPWCGPCRMIAPIVDELAQEFEGKLKAFKLNTDESPGVAAEYGIRSIPTVMFFKDGSKMDTVIGAVPKTTLVQTIEKYID